MLSWWMIAPASAVIGALCGFISRSVLSGILAAAIPWLALLVALVYSVYFVPYGGGGAVFWPLAQLFGGSLAAASGYAGFTLLKWLKR
ncbi:hypothetical protein [Gilvimarinus algae]|uniref:Uncharacterized protein n=1 Tax=Gilvimarinus algae TaxID=3058037 RepID=A0ABT8TG46_9GAMM|nr:hypothetical protein [Gilvimarinus sp. SDUM040014]MDO3383056.1 hypothetical protein [Gilvimarinus sp. SDUM040014]